jgi:D-alanyl-D-alanine carboxypeptidase
MDFNMKKKFYFTSFIIMMFCSLQSSSFTIYAKENWPAGPEIVTDSAIVMDVETGVVLFEKNAHEKMYPASITKILTGLLAVENSKLDEKVTFSEDSVFKTEGSGIARDVGEIMTLEQCLYGMMLNSANECAYAIAEHSGGSYDKFIKMMNKRLKELGCKDTHFNNPHGLPDKQHYTSSYDMALIGRAAIQNDTFRKITSTVSYTIPPTNKHINENTDLLNHHKMLAPGNEFYYELCIGGKTGYTEAAGNTLVTFAEKDDMTLVSVVFKEDTPNHYTDTKALLDYCFNNFKIWNISDNETRYTDSTLPQNGFLTKENFVGIDSNAKVILPLTVDFKETTTEIKYDQLNKDIVGIMNYSYAGKVVGNAAIKRSEIEVSKFPFGEMQILEKEQNKVINIDLRLIIRIVLIIVALILVIIGILWYRGFSRSRFGHSMRKRSSGPDYRVRHRKWRK